MVMMKLEDYRQGYPRLAAFLSIDKNFTILKRYDYLHIRSLLDLQDQLSDLQDQLRICEDSDRVQLGFSSRRQDENTQRRDLMQRIRSTLDVYALETPSPQIFNKSPDKAVQDYNNMLRLPDAQPTQRQSVENWVLGNKPLVRSESACFLDLSTDTDYVALGATEKNERSGLEYMVELLLKAFPRLAKPFSTSQSKTLDPNIVIFSPHFLDRVFKVLVAVFVPLWLVFPIILLQISTSVVPRTIVYVIFTFWTSILLLAAVNTTKYNFLLALITYAALLGAFLAESSPSS